VEVEIPLDADGFLDQECPTCLRVFRVVVDDELAEPADGRTGCPYCGARLQGSEFLTPEQVDYLTDLAGDQAINEIEAMGLEVEREGVRSPLPEPRGDLPIARFDCHVSHQVKVMASWVEAGQPLYCTVCGAER
jgi:hypothetical protein